MQTLFGLAVATIVWISFWWLVVKVCSAHDRRIDPIPPARIAGGKRDAKHYARRMATYAGDTALSVASSIVFVLPWVAVAAAAIFGCLVLAR